ncbi:MAG: phosphoesterase [Bacteroidetes bacterium]|nr:phosphoesterase [Bacteroidota bacterium]
MPEENYLEEHVLVFPAKLLDEAGYFQGLSFDMEKYSEIIHNSSNHLFIKRKDAENNPEYKQLIPYAILHCGSKVFIYRRGKLLAEKRLHGNFSLGVGGHISATDPGLFGTSYEDGLKREINEEVYIESKYKQRIVALLNDDSNDVGRVHLGIVHLLTLEKPIVRPKEKSINETKFTDMEELRRTIDMFENWSKICIENIGKILDCAH